MTFPGKTQEQGSEWDNAAKLLPAVPENNDLDQRPPFRGHGEEQQPNKGERASSDGVQQPNKSGRFVAHERAMEYVVIVIEERRTWRVRIRATRQQAFSNGATGP